MSIRATAAVCKITHNKQRHTLSKFFIATGMNALIIVVVCSTPPWKGIASTRLLTCERPPDGSAIKISGDFACKAFNYPVGVTVTK